MQILRDHTQTNTGQLTYCSAINSSGSAGKFVNENVWHLGGMRSYLAAEAGITIDIMTVDF